MQQFSSSIINSVWTTDVRGASVRITEHVPGLLPPPGQASLVEWVRSFHPDEGERTANLFAGALRRQQALRHEHRVLCTDRTTRQVLATCIPCFDVDGRCTGFTGAFVDMTERQHHLEQVLRSEAQHRVIVDNSMDLIAYCRPDGLYAHVSPSYTQAIGWESREMVGQPVIDFLHPDDRPGAGQALSRIFAGEEIADVVEVRKRCRDGRYVSIGTKVRKVTDPTSGRVIGAVLVSRDIGREKEMLARIERMAEQNTALIENSPDIMMLLDFEGSILHVNKAVEQILGYRIGELAGRSGLEFICPSAHGEIAEHLAILKQGAGHLSTALPCLHSDGSVLLLDWSMCRPAGGNLIYAAARDVTDQHRTRIALEHAHAHVRTILESIDDGFFSVNTKWEITFANTIAAVFAGIDLHDAIGKVVWDVAPGLAESSVGAHYRRAMEMRASSSVELFYEPAGAWMSLRIYAHEDGLSIFFHDISDRVRSDLLVRESERRLRQMIEITPAGYVLTDAAGTVQEVNPALCQLSGYARDELVGSAIADFLLPGGDEAALNVGRIGDPTHALETVIRHKGGQMVHVLVNQTIERGADGRAHALTAFITDITESKHARDRLEQLATRDALTGLPNRAWLNGHLKAMLGEARSKAATTVLFIDLNRFKEVNDSMGHAAGDYLLQQVGRRLESCMRPGDVVARLGGDEFVVAANCAGTEAAAAIATRLLAALKEPFHLDGLEMCVGASIGISLSGQEVDTPELLFQNADTAMYRAKAAGNSSYRFFEPEMSSEAMRKLQIEMALRHALELGQFSVHYQPRIDLRTMRICSMEALLRWRHPDLGQVAPLEFIPIAEERGHIEAIGKWVLQEACREGRRLIDRYGIALHVSVNVSARQLRSACLEAEVAQALRDSGLPPGALELELTESALIDDIEHSASLLQRLKSLGVKVSIDDFGTGYSSLAYLKRFPVDVLKLDRSFFHGQSGGAGNEDFVKALIDMAHALGLQVVAEGIETGELAENLRRASCDQGQGYLFARPMAVTDLEAWLRYELARPAAPLQAI